MKLSEMSASSLKKLHEELFYEWDSLRKKKASYDMSRGKPGEEQLALSGGLMTCLADSEYMAEDIDCRNYGGLDGLPEMKKIFADMLGMKPEQIIVGGNSSLAMMFDSVAANLTHGAGGHRPWQKQGDVKFLCPVPGYDRHFSICEYFNIEMLPVPMDEFGPDMDKVESLTAGDPLVKGMWCVPRYSNPEGIVYSEKTVLRLAALKPAADDFRLYWDDAYAIHHLYGNIARIPNIVEECAKAGSPDMPYVFASFSKISFSGAAVACVGSSLKNVEHIKTRLRIQTIGPDKINQLRHVKFFKNFKGVLRQMDRHAAIMRPKFDLIYETLERELAPLDICRWSKPEGGYFISFYARRGQAKKIVKYCAACGLKLTGAGAAYPYGNDPDDSNIRLAPSYPSLYELKKALDIFTLCVKLAAAEGRMGKAGQP